MTLSRNVSLKDSSSICTFFSRGNLGNINIAIMLLKNIKKERVEFRLEVFFGSSLNHDAGISFQIVAPTLEKALFRISSLDFLYIKFIC